MVAQVINRINQKLEKTVSFKNFFSNPTIVELSTKLVDRQYHTIPLARENNSYPLAPSQERLWFLSQLDGGENAYNMGAAFQLNGELNKEILETAFEYLINHYEILRTNFVADHAGQVQQIVQIKK